MFQGSISSTQGKGPGLFQEKDQGTITAKSYSRHVVPIIIQYTSRWRLLLMQDNASGHVAKATLKEMERWGIRLIVWPANSPDLNPIETLWGQIKDYIYKKYPKIYRSYPRLREAIIEAWNSITDKQIRELIETMPQRCQDVIDTQGGYIKQQRNNDIYI